MLSRTIGAIVIHTTGNNQEGHFFSLDSGRRFSRSYERAILMIGMQGLSLGDEFGNEDQSAAESEIEGIQAQSTIEGMKAQSTIEGDDNTVESVQDNNNFELHGVKENS